MDESSVESRERPNVLNKISERIQNIVAESSFPNKGYKSTCSFYGGRLIMDGGKLVYDITGMVSKFDRWGDPMLRTYDEHISKTNFWDILRTHPKWALRLLNPGPKRFRGTKEQMLSNIQRLGLEKYYGEHPKGIEIREPDIFYHGIPLQDIWRANRIHSPILDKIDRFKALREASEYLRYIHSSYGAIGEPLSGDIIFQRNQDGVVANPVFNLPDIVWNPAKEFGRAEQKATDMLDFMISIGVEELNRSDNWDQVKTALQTIVEGYGSDKSNKDDIITWTGSLAKRGRLTLNHPLFTKLHNFARLGIKPEWADPLRLAVVAACS